MTEALFCDRCNTDIVRAGAEDWVSVDIRRLGTSWGLTEPDLNATLHFCHTCQVGFRHTVENWMASE